MARKQITRWDIGVCFLRLVDLGSKTTGEDRFFGAG